MVNISFLMENVERIVKIDDVFLPPVIHNLVKRYAFSFYNELWSNQEKFIVDYRFGVYSIDGETPQEEQDRLFRNLFEKHPYLMTLIDDAEDTFKVDSSTFDF